MKENEISRILAMQERALMLKELIKPEVLREGKMFLDEDLMLVNQLIKKAEMAVISAIDPEVERFFKWIIEQFDAQVTKNAGAKVFKVTIFVRYDESDEHVKVHTIPKYEEEILFVVDKKGYGEGIAVINKTLEKIDILKNFDLLSTGQEGDYKGWPYRIRNIIMRLDLL